MDKMLQINLALGWLKHHWKPLAVIVCGGYLAFLAYVEVELSPYAKRMMQEGFPKDYARQLSLLHRKHPSWTFELLPINDLDWSKVVETECTPGWNLVPYTNWAPKKWLKLGLENYKPYFAPNAKAYDSGSWYQASKEAIAYFLDPRNFLNEKDVFMFEALAFNRRAHTMNAIELALSNSFMFKAKYDGGSNRYSELLLEVGKELGISPVFLAGRLALEQGSGTVQSSGTIGDSLLSLFESTTNKIGSSSIWGKAYTQNSSSTSNVVARGASAYNGYFNFFNIRACGLGLFEIRYNAWKEASEVSPEYFGPWTTQEAAIRGGAKKVRESYLDTFRHTRYLQKFSVDQKSGKFRWKQYMQSIIAPLLEARKAELSYRESGSINAPHHFIIPVYKKMPLSPAADPAHGNSTLSPSK